MTEATCPLTEVTQTVVAQAMGPTNEAMQAMVASALAPAREVAATIAQQAFARYLPMPLLPALDDLQAAIRLSLPYISVLGPDLSRDLLQTLGNTETISRQLDTGALVDDNEPGHGDGAERAQQLRERIHTTLSQPIVLEARVRERATELNDGLDAYLGLISTAMILLTFAYTWLGTLIK